MPDRPALRARYRPAVRLGSAHSRWLYAAFILLWLSGVAWILFHYFMQVSGDFGPRPHPLQQWWLRLHGLAAMLSLVALGTVLPNHVRGAWTLARNRMAGAGLILILIWLVITGYALYYLAGAVSQDLLSLLHWIPGLLLPPALWLHIRRGRGCPGGRAPGADGTAVERGKNRPEPNRRTGMHRQAATAYGPPVFPPGDKNPGRTDRFEIALHL